MAVLAARRVSRPLLRRVTAMWGRGRARLAAATGSPRAVARNLASIPLTVAGIGCLDAAAFVGNEIAGLAVTGVSLIALEFLIADKD